MRDTNFIINSIIAIVMLLLTTYYFVRFDWMENGENEDGDIETYNHQSIHTTEREFSTHYC